MCKFMRILLVACLSLLFQLGFFANHSANAQPDVDPDDWILIWSDEFEGDEIDATKWRVEDAALVKNNEKQYYTPEDVYLEDGRLVLRSQKRFMGGRDYTSGLVETKGLFTQTYGYFEIRAKLPKGQGIWPAHWMMNAVGTWPPEIDIMEMLGHKPNKIHMTNHFGIHPNNSRQGGSYVGPDYSEDFHTFAVEWGPNILRWYIDGVERFSTKRHVHDVPFYIILNTAVGGHWPGYPDDTTEFPQYHYIEYVRVYKRNVAGQAFVIASAEHGDVSVYPDLERHELGAVIEIKADPDIGYRFKQWQGDIQGEDNPLQMKLTDNIKVMAEFEVDPEAPANISLGQTVVASSMESDSLSAERAVDGNYSSRWSSKFSDPQWIYIDLQQQHHIQALRLNWENAYAQDYEIQVSDDTVNWETVKSMENAPGQVENIWLENVKGRYVRVYGSKRATEWGYSLWEFEIFGEQVQASSD